MKNKLIIFLTLVIVGLGCYIVYDKVMDNKKTNINNNENVNENKEEVKDNKLYHIEKLEDESFWFGFNESGVAAEYMSFDYPVIDIDTEEIRKVNNEILNKYKEIQSFINTSFVNVIEESLNRELCNYYLARNGKKYGKSEVMKTLKYYISESEKYLSVIIGEEDPGICGVGFYNYFGYVINKETNKLMSNSEILKMFNVDDEQLFIDKHNKAAEAFYHEKATSIDDVRIYIYNNELVLCETTIGDYLVKYNNKW